MDESFPYKERVLDLIAASPSLGAVGRAGVSYERVLDLAKRGTFSWNFTTHLRGVDCGGRMTEILMERPYDEVPVLAHAKLDSRVVKLGKILEGASYHDLMCCARGMHWKEVNYDDVARDYSAPELVRGIARHKQHVLNFLLEQFDESFKRLEDIAGEHGYSPKELETLILQESDTLGVIVEFNPLLVGILEDVVPLGFYLGTDVMTCSPPSYMLDMIDRIIVPPDSFDAYFLKKSLGDF